jgi:iron(III) transport system permease protein
VSSSGHIALKAPSAPRGRFAWRWPRLNGLVWFSFVPAFLIVALLVLVLWIAVRDDVVLGPFSLVHFTTLYADPLAYAAMMNTLGFASVTLVVSLTIGVPLAWLVERTDLGGRTFIVTAMTLGILLPGFFMAMGWLFLLHPRAGILNRMLMDAFGLTEAPLSIVTVPGMGFIEGIALTPVVFVMTAAALRAMDVSLEECARMSGASGGGALRRVTTPLVGPAILGAACFVFVIGIAAFDIPAIIGLSNRIFTFATYIALRVYPDQGLPQYGLSAAFSTFMIALGLAISWLYTRLIAKGRRYQVVGGRGYRTGQHRLGKWRLPAWGFVLLYLFLAEVLPLVVVGWAALLPFLEPPSAAAIGRLGFGNFQQAPWPSLGKALQVSAILFFGVPTIALAFSVALSWVVVRSKNRFRLIFDGVAFMPHAVPHIVFGLAAVVATLFLIPPSFGLYNSMYTLMIVLALVYLSFGTRVANGALIQIQSELEEAGAMAGAPAFAVLRRIVLPILKPALTYAWLWLAMLTFRELTLSTMILFNAADSQTLPVVIFSLFTSGAIGQSAASALVLVVCLAPIVALYMAVAGSRFRSFA